jgi:hypothetical protein
MSERKDSFLNPNLGGLINDVKGLIRPPVTIAPRQQEGRRPEYFDTEFQRILYKIEREFKSEPCKTEKDLQSQLKIWLDAKYPGRVEREVSSARGKIDIVMDQRNGLEVKIATNKGVLRNLIGQIVTYKRCFNEVGIVLMDVGKLQQSIITEFQKEYSHQQVDSIVIRGTMIKKSNRKKKRK